MQGLKLAIQRDDKELKQLEKNLNFRKKKGKTSLPTSFVNDGLDCIFFLADTYIRNIFVVKGLDYTICLFFVLQR